MSGVEFRDGAIFVDRSPNALDELAIEFSALLAERDVDHVFVAGYVAILTGRARATEDVDVLIERLPAEEIGGLVEELEAAGYWGPAMPLDAMYDSLSEGTNIWVAPDDQVTPHLEVKFPTDELDRASLENPVEAHVGGRSIQIGPLELQIAYKLYLGGQKDLEDAAHLYTLFADTLRPDALETWADRLDVTDQYQRLTDR